MNIFITGLLTVTYLSVVMCVPCMHTLEQVAVVTYVKENESHTADKDSSVYTNIIQIAANDESLHELNDYYPHGKPNRHGFVKTADPRRIHFMGLVESYNDDGA